MGCTETCLFLGIRELKRLIVKGHSYLGKDGAGSDFRAILLPMGDSVGGERVESR